MQSTGASSQRAIRNDVVLFLTVGAIGLSTLVLAIIYVNGTVILFAGVAAASAIQWNLLQRAIRQPVPLAGIVVVGINLVGVLGWRFYPTLSDRATVSAGLPETRQVYTGAAIIFIVASASIFAGGMAAKTRRPITGAALGEHVRNALGAMQRISAGKLAGLSLCPLLVVVAAYTPTGLWERANYQDRGGPTIMVGLAAVSLPPGIAMASMLMLGGVKRPALVAWPILISYIVVVFSMGSRGFALIPAMLLLTYLASGGNSNRAIRLTAIALGITFTLLFLQLPLNLRGSVNNAGLQPYWQVIVTHPGTLVALNGLAGTLGNILFSVPLAGTIQLIEPFPKHYLVTSLNPLPGVFTDWGQIRDSMRINYYTPTSGLGELRSYGSAYLVGFCFIFGWTMTRLQQWNSKLPVAPAALAAVAGIGVSGSFTLGILQYNLRADVRQIWYFILLSVVLHLVPQMKSKTRSP